MTIEVLPEVAERTARTLAAVLCMQPGTDRLSREFERLNTKYGWTIACRIWRRAHELYAERKE